MDTYLGRSVLVVHEFVGGTRPIGETLHELTALTTAAVGADAAGLTLSDDSGRATTAVFTDDVVPEIDQAQYDADDGPCLRAFRSKSVVRVDDISTDERWPSFDEAALHHGMHSSLSLPVHVADAGIGALNLYASNRSRFDDASVALGSLLAGQAAIVSAYYDKADTADHLRVAMESRADIEQAKGIIMASTGCSPDDAFAVLRQQSQNENRKLREIAAEIVARQLRRSGA
jgi:transcriptional regulator with GAF, ATPase, and Fis domain